MSNRHLSLSLSTSSIEHLRGWYMHMCCEQPWRKMTTSKQGPTLYHGSSNELHSKILHHGQYILSVVQTNTSSWLSNSDIWLVPLLFLSSSDSQFDRKMHEISRDWISLFARISKIHDGPPAPSHAFSSQAFSRDDFNILI